MNEYMNEIIKAIEYAENKKNITVYNCIESIKNKNIVAFGLGKFFEDTHERLFKNFNIKYLCDNNSEKWNKDFYGKRCISVDELRKIDNLFVIVVMGDCRDVIKQLNKYNIPSIPITELHFSKYNKGYDCGWLKDSIEKIEKTLNILDDESKEVFVKVFCKKIYMNNYKYEYSDFAKNGEYFRNGLWKLSDNECFVDGGAYIGDTINQFLSQVNNKFEKIFSFEYEKENFKILEKNIQNLDEKIKNKIFLNNCGIWDKKEEKWCEFFGESDGTEIIDSDKISDKSEKCYLNSLDNILKNEKVSLIKLDIEGAEIQGIIGAKAIIKEQKPKLAICLYHRPEDLWEIPLLIKNINNDYKFKIVHHGFLNYTDTVLYAE